MEDDLFNMYADVEMISGNHEEVIINSNMPLLSQAMKNSQNQYLAHHFSINLDLTDKTRSETEQKYQ